MDETQQGGTGLLRIPGRCEGSGWELFHLPRIHTHTPPSFWEIFLIFSATVVLSAVTVEASLTLDPNGSIWEWHQTQPDQLWHSALHTKPFSRHISCSGAGNQT